MNKLFRNCTKKWKQRKIKNTRNRTRKGGNWFPMQSQQQKQQLQQQQQQQQSSLNEYFDSLNKIIEKSKKLADFEYGLAHESEEKLNYLANMISSFISKNKNKKSLNQIRINELCTNLLIAVNNHMRNRKSGGDYFLTNVYDKFLTETKFKLNKMQQINNNNNNNRGTALPTPRRV